MYIINKFPQDKDFFPKIVLKNTREIMVDEIKINYSVNSDNDFRKKDWKHNQIIKNFILSINDDGFWNLIKLRLCLPSTSLEIKRVLNDIDIEFWTIEHLIDELFLQIAKKREIINYKDKKFTIYKYYYQALRMWKGIPISKPKAKFIVNISDLTPRIYCELKSLENHTAQYVLKESVRRIFENIDFKLYHEHIENNLEVVLED